ncbi:granulocyte colony-stimulating factor receptor [Pelodytes ibericus]
MKRYVNILLGVMLLLIFLPGDARSFNSITVNSPILLGSNLTAYCTVNRELCNGLEDDKFQIKWKLDNELVPSTQYDYPSKNTTRVFFNSFNKTFGLLSCYVLGPKGLQLIDRKDIEAGYPPSPPTNLTCLMNLTDNILKCTWQLGRDPHIETNVTLSSTRANEQCERAAEMQEDFTPSKDQMSGLIPRKHFRPYKKLSVWITVTNALGTSVSPILCIVPMHEVKLDPPIIEEVTVSGQGCVRLQWRNGKKTSFIVDQIYQLRYRREHEKEWTGPLELASLNNTVLCGLLSAWKYHFQLRCIRSYKTGVWSEWGQEGSLITPETAPTGKLETWWTMKKVKDGIPMKIQLLWKALRREEANAEHVWYIVTISSDLQESDAVVCNTTALNCTFSPPQGVKSVRVWVYNRAAHSEGTEITFSVMTGDPVSSIRASPNGDYSLYVEWEPKPSSKSYILEWCKSSDYPDCEISWKREPGGSSFSSLHDNIEPFQMYTVSLYPIYEEMVGLPVQIEAYSKQGAPPISPKLTLIRTTKSQAELSWEPIPLESRHGFITSYTIYWTDSNENVQFAVLKGTSTRYVIKNLVSSSVYKVILSSSTSGGSTNGTVMMIHTGFLDEIEINMLIMVLCLFFVVVIVVILILCIMKHERMKNRFWPNVPDPANSIMGNWDPITQEKPKMTFNPKDVCQIITSDITILEGWSLKKQPKEYQSKPSPIFQKEYSRKCPVPPQSSTENMHTLRSYVNAGDTVQYAKVITGGYREQSPPSSLYIRSDSTQPLLYDASPSPKNYENMWFHVNKQDDSVFFVEEENLTDFPLLQALKVQEEGEPFSLYG